MQRDDDEPIGQHKEFCDPSVRVLERNASVARISYAVKIAVGYVVNSAANR